MDSPVPATSENHGGILIPLTDNQAYLELVNGNRKKGRTSTRRPSWPTCSKPTRRRPSSEAPTSVEVKIGTPKGEQVVALKASPDSADPHGKLSLRLEARLFELNQTGGEGDSAGRRQDALREVPRPALSCQRPCSPSAGVRHLPPRKPWPRTGPSLDPLRRPC